MGDASNALQPAMLTLIRRIAPFLLIAGVLGGLIAGIVGAVVAQHAERRYTVEAVFYVKKRGKKIPFVSFNKTIVAEQVSRQLSDAPANQAAEQAIGKKIAGEWHTGPKYGEITYRVTANNAITAQRAARGVYDKAGPTGRGLFAGKDSPGTLQRRRVTTAKATSAPTLLIVTGAAGLSALAGMALVALWAVPLHRGKRSRAKSWQVSGL